jgi:hypothetical protein
MKCEVCLEMLDEYLDGELSAGEASEVAAHLITCSTCSTESAALAADQEIFLRYDRELEIPASMWGQIAEQTVAPTFQSVAPVSLGARIAEFFRVPAFGFSFAAVAVLIVVAIVVGAMYLRSQKPAEKMNAKTNESPAKMVPDPPTAPKDSKPEDRKTNEVAFKPKPKAKRSVKTERAPIDQSDVLSTDFGYVDVDDRDTAIHLEQTQNLLRSIRNVSLEDNDQEIDVTYDKALSRRLLNENIVLRRDAEMKAKFPTKSLLSDLEPFLIDIANLPDHAKPNEVRVIKERVQRTEIVAALIGY